MGVCPYVDSSQDEFWDARWGWASLAAEANDVTIRVPILQRFQYPTLRQTTTSKTMAQYR